MKIRIYLLTLLIAITAFTACNKEDDGVIVVPERDRAEQQAEDRDTLIAYLESHYYNSGDFAGNTNPSLNDLVITELPEGESVPADHTLLIDAVETHQTVLLDVDYEYYILRLNQGGGAESPAFSDSVRLNYSGNLLDGEVFDSSINPVVFDLTGLIPGWSRVIPEFNTAADFVENGDGTISYNNAGVGAMFIPSGLGYFSGGAPGVPVYSCLVFKFDIFQMQENDHDQDGVPTYLEDYDEDLDLTDEDTDEDGTADFIDVDDDGDGILTRNEDLEPDTDLEVDSDGDGDPTNDIGDGDPTNDDTDNDGIPNYLDEDDDGSNEDDADGDGIPDYIDND